MARHKGAGRAKGQGGLLGWPWILSKQESWREDEDLSGDCL